jgi:RsiW-degrading membrane proteinase PrsW (M82 family)
MIRRTRLPTAIAFLLGGVAVVLMAYSTTDAAKPSTALIFSAIACADLAVLAAIWAVLGVDLRLRTLLTGAFVGLVAALALFLLLLLPIAIVSPGFEDRLRDFVRSPTTFVDRNSIDMFLVLVAVVVAPLTEEPAKALGAMFAKPTTRRTAFLAGATAGAGFAIFENLGYSAAAAADATVWRETLILRSLSGALHPLATALVVLGVVEWRARRRPRAIWLGLGAGIGIHALWNGTAVVLDVVQFGTEAGELPGIARAAALIYTGALGVAMGLVVLAVAREVRKREPMLEPGMPPPPPIAPRPYLERRAWAGLGLATGVPVLTIVVVYPMVF